MSTMDDIEIVRTMLRCYVHWLFEAYPNETEDLSSYFSPDRLQQALNRVSSKFVSPNGIALIARDGRNPVGCVLAHSIEPGIAEIKHLSVLPGTRGTGLGRALIEALKEKMNTLGHPTIRLDTANFLTGAISLYRRMGFVEIDPYTDVPAGSVRTAIFMEWRN